ncbi:MAG: hypothetical protein ACJZ8O_10415 [Pirellulaceae bacterium]
MAKQKIDVRLIKSQQPKPKKNWTDGSIAVTPNRFWAISVFFAITFGSMAYNTVGTQMTGIDDANIFLTYAKNVSNFDGMVFNVGEEPVEGFTSMLWMLVCSVLSFITDRPEPALFGLNILFVITAVAILQWFVQEQLSEKRESDSGLDRGALRYVRWCCAVIIFGWVFFSPKFMIWSTITLMDIGIWAMVLAVGSVCFARAISVSSPTIKTDKMLIVSTILAVLVRPEGILVAICWWLCLGIARKRLSSSESVSMVSVTKIPLITLLVSVLVLTVFRFIYFGYPVPNTFYAKVSDDWFGNIWNGLGYLRDFAITQPWVIAFGLIALVYAIRFFRRVDDELDNDDHARKLSWGLIAVSAVVSMIPPVLTGGDHFHLARFFQPAWPLVVIPGIHLFHKYCTSPKFITEKPMRRIITTTLVLVAMFWVAQQPKWEQISRPINRIDDREKAKIAVEFINAMHGRDIGAELSTRVGGKFSVAAIRVGGLGLTYSGPVIDLMGLNNKQMAHAPGSLEGDKNHAAFKPEVFWIQNPDLVEPKFVSFGNESRIMDRLLPSADSFDDKALKGILRSEEFLSKYTPIMWPTTDSSHSNGFVAVWCRNDKLKLLDGATVLQVN